MYVVAIKIHGQNWTSVEITPFESYADALEFAHREQEDEASSATIYHLRFGDTREVYFYAEARDE